jgi:hypothetical protein
VILIRQYLNWEEEEKEKKRDMSVFELSMLTNTLEMQNFFASARFLPNIL